MPVASRWRIIGTGGSVQLTRGLPSSVASLAVDVPSRRASSWYATGRSIRRGAKPTGIASLVSLSLASDGSSEIKTGVVCQVSQLHLQMASHSTRSCLISTVCLAPTCCTLSEQRRHTASRRCSGPVASPLPGANAIVPRICRRSSSFSIRLGEDARRGARPSSSTTTPAIF